METTTKSFSYLCEVVAAKSEVVLAVKLSQTIDFGFDIKQGISIVQELPIFGYYVPTLTSYIQSELFDFYQKCLVGKAFMCTTHKIGTTGKYGIDIYYAPQKCGLGKYLEDNNLLKRIC